MNNFGIFTLLEWIDIINKMSDYPVFQTIIISKKGNLFLQRSEEGSVDKIMCVKNANRQCGEWCMHFQYPRIKSAMEIFKTLLRDRSLCMLKLCDNHTLHSWFVVDPGSSVWAEPEDIKEILETIEGE